MWYSLGMKKFGFTIHEKMKGDMIGRVGTIHTPHGDIETPAFITVGTKATVKSLTPEQVSSLGAQSVLANTYHLYLAPGDELVRDSGGLGKFMHWDGPTFTDSGGFQVFSLGTAFGKGVGKVATGEVSQVNNDRQHEKLAQIDDDGVTFKSCLDGSTHRFTPERSIQIQHNIGADIIFAFDECTSPTDTLEYQRESLERTHEWAKRSLDEHEHLGGLQALYGVVQGGRFQDLREHSARTLGEMEFDGYGIGGSFTKNDIATAVRWVTNILPETKPRHLLGIGEPIDLFLGIENGIDTFDCVAPTRIARNGSLYTKGGRINITNAQFVSDFTAPDEGCACYTCTHYTRAYIAHLFHAKEMLAATLSSIHNLYFITKLVADIRQSMLDDNYQELKESTLKNYYKD